MALIVEDGSIVADANSFTSVAFADAHHLERGNTAWAALANEQKEQALIRATDFEERRYDGRWRGVRVSKTQSLSFPRDDVYESGDSMRPVANDTIPVRLQRATAELALRAATIDLQPDLTPGEAAAVKRQKVGQLEVEYADSRMLNSPVFFMVADLLRPLLRRSANVVEIVRS